MREITIGTRGSALALAQTNWVADQIRHHNPGIEVRTEIIKTKGDKILDTPLAKIGDKGLFVKEIEVALAEKQVDLAVHSLKDLPAEMTDGLTIGAIPKRVDPSDVFLSQKGGLDDLPAGSRIGSSSLRRKAQILHNYPELEFVDLRGNLDTRLRKLLEDHYDAIILASAGLERLGVVEFDGEDLRVIASEYEKIAITQRIPFEISLPAVGQGALAIQIRENDPETAEIVAPLDDPVSRATVTAERAVLFALGGGCQVPIAAVAVSDGVDISLRAMVSNLDGSDMIRADSADLLENAAELGRKVAGVLLESGAGEILSGVRSESGPTDMGAA